MSLNEQFPEQQTGKLGLKP